MNLELAMQSRRHCPWLGVRGLGSCCSSPVAKAGTTPCVVSHHRPGSLNYRGSTFPTALGLTSLRSLCPLVHFCLRVLSWLVHSHHRLCPHKAFPWSKFKEREWCLSPSSDRMANPIMRAPHSWPRLTLIPSQRPYLLTPSHWD